MTKPPKPYEILIAVESATGVPPQVILSDNRVTQNAYARFLAMALYKKLSPWVSNLQVAQFTGKKDPTTARHGLMRADYLLDTDPAFKSAFDRAMAALEK